ncbi:putative TNP1-like transposon protein [Cucumis melo var. makuwa]|uniref:TNP1-like transposon protein n=1 Tax=Cucumis melo var. makuwa TaxID=1194695 RepID=A0A5A7UTC4_CUCMM|nr:putative TNP1-like transposon protein [Cucumis melo var. makuwa]
MKVLKGYVQNKARPKGCIGTCYSADECVDFSNKYFKQSVEVVNSQQRKEEYQNDVILEDRPISSGTSVELFDDVLENAHRYVLFNTSEIELDSSVEGYSELLKWLANGPRKNAMSYTGYIINGKRFHTKSVEKSTQNNGVAVDATTLCRSNAKDKSQVMDVVAYYGVLQEIILLDYYVYQLPIFKCDWANVRNGVKVEEGFTLVNLHQTPPKGFHDLEMYDENYDDTLVSNENISNAVEDVDESDKLTYARQDCEDTMSLKLKSKRRSTRRKLIADSLLLPNEENMESSPIDVHPNTLSPKPSDKIVEGNPILDSPAARTRLAIRRQATTSNMNGFEEPPLETTTLPNEKAVEDHVVDEEPPFETMTLRKKTRGPTKMKTIAVEKQSRVDIVFNEYGQPIGNESVGLASFLGPLVREVIPVNLENWLKLPTRLKVVLWKSIRSRYNVEDWQKTFFFQKMGRLWRTGKYRLVKQIRDAPTKDAILKLMPDNLQSVDDWMDFVSENTSATFKLQSEKYKAMKKKQLPHTCSRKGYASLAEEMRKSSSDPSSVTRVALWTKAHKRKDGQPVNSQVTDTLESIKQTEAETTVSTTNMVDDALSKVLGPDRGHVRGFGFGVTRSKLSLLSQQDHKYKTEPSEELSNATASVLKRLNIPPMPSPSYLIFVFSHSINNNSQTKCKLLDWYGSGEIVAEGRWSSNDPTALVHHVPIGPHAISVWVDVAKKPNAYLWRPTSEMTCIEEALGSTVAWPSDKVNEMESSSPDD